MSVVMTDERSDFERRVISAFGEEISATSHADRPDCTKVETYHFRCRAAGRTYDLTYRDTGCWRAITKEPSGPLRRVSGCLLEHTTTSSSSFAAIHAGLEGDARARRARGRCQKPRRRSMSRATVAL
jgi:hypothetical protein